MNNSSKYNFLIEKLDSEIIPRKFVEHNNSIYIFYVSKKYLESGFDDRYRVIGLGPILYNKIDGTFKKLSYLEFLNEHFDANIFEEYTEEDISFNEVKSNFIERGHINFEEFELIMTALNIDMHAVLFITEDDRFIEIKSENKDYITKFIIFFGETGFEVEIKSDNQITLDNGVLED